MSLFCGEVFLLQQSDCFIKVVYFSKLPLSWSFGYREQDFVWLLLSVPLGTSKLLPSLLASLGYMINKKKKKERNLENSPPFVPWVLSSLASLIFSLYLPKYSYVYFIYNFQHFQLYIAGARCKMISIPLSREEMIFICIFKI